MATENHLTIGLTIAAFVGLLLITLFAYLWVQLAYHIYSEIAALNIFYAIGGLIVLVCGIFLSFLHHQTGGELLAIWGVGLIFIVLFYYILAL